MNNIEEDHLLHLIIDSFQGLLSYIDKDERYQFVNKAYSEWFGRSDLKGKSLKEVFGDFYEGRKDKIQSVLQGKKVVFQADTPHLTKGPIPTEMTYTPHFDKKGEVKGFIVVVRDLSEQKKTEEVLINAQRVAEEEKEKLYSLLLHAPISICVFLGPEHQVDLINILARRSIKNRDISGMKLVEAVPSLQESNILDCINKVYQTGIHQVIEDVPVEMEYEGGRIEKRCFDLYYEPWRNKSGEVIGILHIGMDVTDKKSEKERSLANEMKFKSFSESMPQMSFITNSDGVIKYCNQRWFEFTGLRIEDFNLIDWKRILHPQDYQKSIDVYLDSYKTGSSYQIEHRLRRKDGVYRWHLGRAIPMKDESGKITGWAGTDTDIHEQKEYEEHQSRLIQVIESSSDFIAISDIEGKGLFLNNAAMKMMGLELNHNLSNVSIMDFFFDEDKPFVEETILKATVLRGSWTGDFRLKNFKTGEGKWFNINFFLTKDSKGKMTGFATLSRDLTEIKTKERSLERALKSRDDFLSVASHELKTPLTTLKLRAQLLMRSLERGEAQTYTKEKLETYSKQSNELVTRLSRLIDDMLDVSRIRTGKLNLDKTEVNLKELLEEVVSRVEMEFIESGIPLPEVECSETIIGHWDRLRLEQVILNLLTNALKYGKQLPIFIKMWAANDKAYFSVRDQGYGIPEADLSRIFDRFERAISSSEVSGLGLGLFITNQLVQAHQGKIWAESDYGHGATFTVQLPKI